MGWDRCCCQAGLLPPIFLASSFHPLGLMLRFCCSPFFLFIFLSVSQAAQSAVKSIAKSHGEQAGLLRLSYPAPLPFPHTECLTLRTSPQQTFYNFFFYFFFPLFIYFSCIFPLPSIPPLTWRLWAPVWHSPGFGLLLLISCHPPALHGDLIRVLSRPRGRH